MTSSSDDANGRRPKAPIFDPVERIDSTPADQAETTFDFLNRVAGEYWVHPRQLIQAWADGINDPLDYQDMRQRLRSRDDQQFRSAFLELFLHECLIRAGYTVTIHPSIPHSARRPDFYAERGEVRFYMEAIAPGTTPEAKAAAQRRAVLFDTVNRLGDPNFLLWLSSLHEGSNPPASARLREALRRWLSRLDPDDYGDIESAPEHRWERNGWAATFKAVPRRPEARQRRPQSSIGVYGHLGVNWVNDATTIRNALVGKHHAYGDLGAPFLIAVGLYIFDSDRWHSTNALYGQEAIQVRETADGETVTRMIRQPDGYFGMPPTWQNRDVSGVLLVNQLMPYSILQAEIAHWRHPNPLRPLPEELGMPALTVSFDGNRLTETPPEITSAEVFGLPDPWPPGNPWPND